MAARPFPWKKALLRLTLALACFFLVGRAVYVGTAGPMHEGKRMREWLQQLYSADPREHKEARQAFLELGARSLPWLTRDLDKTAERGPSHLVELALSKLPGRWRQKLSPQVDLVPAKSRVLEILAEMGPEASPAAGSVAKALYAPNHHLNSMAASALGAIGAPAVLPELARAIQNTNFQVSSMALSAVWQLGTNGAPLLPTIVEAYHRDGNLRPRATLALVKIGPAAEPHLERMLMTNDWSVVKDAAYALGYSQPGTTNFVPRLRQLRAHEDPKLRHNAYVALANVAYISNEAREDVAAGLEDPERAIQLVALKTLSMFPREATNHLRVISRYLDSEDRELQREALRTLANMGRHAAPAREAVARLASSPLREVGQPATWALESIDRHLTNVILRTPLQQPP